MLVRMSPELVELLTEDGWDFGEPDADGFYEPSLHSGPIVLDAAPTWHYEEAVNHDGSIVRWPVLDIP